MSAEVIVDGGLRKLLDRLIAPDFRMLMRRIEALINEDHTRAQLSGLDKDGVPYTRVTYRNGKVSRPKGRNRGQRGVGPALEDADGNLSSAAYRRLTGPPLTPRLKQSRIIANLQTDSGKAGDDWWAESFLVGLVDRKGRPFMHHHFDGDGRNPRRDARGIRPWGMLRIREAIRAEAMRLISGGR